MSFLHSHAVGLTEESPVSDQHVCPDLVLEEQLVRYVALLNPSPPSDFCFCCTAAASRKATRRHRDLNKHVSVIQTSLCVGAARSQTNRTLIIDPNQWQADRESITGGCRDQGRLRATTAPVSTFGRKRSSLRLRHSCVSAAGRAGQCPFDWQQLSYKGNK